MTADDFDKFTEALQLVAAVTNKRLTPDVTTSYFHLLKAESLDPLCHAMERFARSAETGRRFPTPREIRSWMTGAAAPAGLTADQETRIRSRVLDAMDAWERDKIGSARTAFELAWQSALVTDGLHGDVRPLRREAAWSAWLLRGASGDATPEYTDAEADTILRETAAKPLTNVHPNLEIARKADGGARISQTVFGDMLANIARRATAARTPGQPIETVEQACARGDCQYANPFALKPDWTKSCPGHHGNDQCPRRMRWGAIHERPGRTPGEEG